jgi:hypothetical protein
MNSLLHMSSASTGPNLHSWSTSATMMDDFSDFEEDQEHFIKLEANIFENSLSSNFHPNRPPSRTLCTPEMPKDSSSQSVPLASCATAAASISSAFARRSSTNTAPEAVDTGYAGVSDVHYRCGLTFFPDRSFSLFGWW